MEITCRAIDSLTPYARNARTHSAEQIARIAASLDEFGMAGAIVVRDGVIAKGHGTLAAVRRLYVQGHSLYPAPGRAQGAQPYPAGTVPVLDASGWSDAQFRAFVIADNRLAEQAGWDDELLRDELGDLQDEGFDLELTGFEGDELDALLAGPPDTGAAAAAARVTLAERFLVPPFSVFNARDGWWLERKRAWLALGIRSETGREDGLLLNRSLQPPPVYDAKAAYERRTGHAVTMEAFLHANPDVHAQHQTSVFDPVLCEIVYRWFCPPGGTVLDPFAGGSVRGIVAATLGHPYVGIDLRHEQIEANRAQAAAIITRSASTASTLPQWREGDARGIGHLCGDVAADLVFTCPPYVDLERYSDDPRDLSNAKDYAAFTTALRQIVRDACAQLRPDRFACVVVGEVRDARGHYRNFVGDTIEAFRAAGLAYYNEAILVSPLGSLPIRAARWFGSMRKIGKGHQNVLVFVKGEARAAVAACGTVDVVMPGPEPGMDEEGMAEA